MAWSVNASAELKGDRDEGGTAALLLIAGDMLGRRPSGLTGKLREAGLMRLMQAMPTPGIDADRPDMVQALDQAEHRGGLRRLRHLAKPNEPALPAFRPALRQRIQLSALLVGQADGQPPLDLPPRPKAEIATEAFEAPRRRNDNLSPAALLHNQLGQMKEAIVLEGLRMKGLGEFGRGVFSEGAEPVLQFGGMPAAILLGDEIAIDGLRMHVDLFGDKRDQRRRGRSLVRSDRPWVAQVAQHQRIAEAAVIAAAAPDHRAVRLRQRVMANQLTWLRGRIGQCGDLGLARLLSAHCSCSPEAWRRQTSRSGPASRSACCA
jgi:hypothetical protein